MIAKSFTFLLPIIVIVVLTAHAFPQQNGTELGISLYREGRFEQSTEALRDSVMKDSNDKLAWLYLGAALARSGNSKEATKAFRKSNYTFNDAAGDIDTPAKMTIKPRASYTEQARMNGQTGTVKIAVGLDADGTVGFILPFQTLPWGLTENAIAAAKAMRFKPAVKDGKSVSTVTVLSYSFDIY